jgi:hypothetical protein
MNPPSLMPMTGSGGKVVSLQLMVGPFTGHKKPLLLVISQHSWANNLDYVYESVFMSSPDITCTRGK